MQERVKRFYGDHREVLLYLLFGILTFLVDNGTFFVLHLIFDLNQSAILLHACSVCSTLAAITFAYITNRKFVFRSTVTGTHGVLKEAAEFYFARCLGMLIAEVLLQISVVKMEFSAPWMKIAVNVVVIILNYLFSKLWIFRQKEEGDI